MDDIKIDEISSSLQEMKCNKHVNIHSFIHSHLPKTNYLVRHFLAFGALGASVLVCASN